jgi:hypothetical protein
MKTKSKTKKQIAARVAVSKGATAITDKKLAKAMVELERNPALKGSFERIKKILASANRTEAMPRYQIGEEVAAAVKEPKKYGKRSVQTLAMALNLDDATLRGYGDIATTWKRAEVTDLLKRETGSGTTLSVSHLAAVARLAAKRREELIEQALRENLSVRALKKIVAAGKASKKPVSTEAPGKRERRQMSTWLTGAKVEASRRIDDLIALADAHPTTEVSALIAECLEEAVAFMNAIGLKTEELREALANIRSTPGLSERLDDQLKAAS